MDLVIIQIANTAKRDFAAVRRPFRRSIVNGHERRKIWTASAFVRQLSAIAAVRVHRPELESLVVLTIADKNYFSIHLTVGRHGGGGRVVSGFWRDSFDLPGGNRCHYGYHE